MATKQQATEGRKPTPARPHPLDGIATAAIREREAITVHELAELLGGRKAHHRKLAGEVLDGLEARGLAWSNDADQFRLHDDGLTEVPCCGIRPASMPRGFEDMGQGWKEFPLDKLVDAFADWVDDNRRDGAAMLLVKGCAIGPDGRVT